MQVKSVDQGQLMLDKLIPQYKNSPNIKTLFQSFSEELCQDIEDQAMQIYNMCDLENTTGNLLDAAGSLIGLARMNILVPTDDWTLDITPWTGYIFADGDFLNYEVAPDEVYRDAIRSYAICHNTVGDIRTLEKTLRLLYGMTVESDLTVQLISSLQVNITVNVSVNIGRRYLVDSYRTPNGSKLWAEVAGCEYTFTYS